jgi:hypothetical protein
MVIPARGIRIGGMIDNDLVSDVHFNPAYPYTGTVNKDNSLVNWVWDNGIVLELVATFGVITKKYFWI